MESIYFLIPLALVLFGVFVWLFFWAVKNNQFEDLDREGSRILFYEDARPKTPASHDQTQPPP